MTVRTPVASIRVEGRHRRELRNIDTLAASLADVGMLQPIVILADGRLVAGERRLTAAKALGWTTVPTHVAADLADAAALLRAERDENTCREPMTPTEEASIYEALLAIERERHASRQGERTDLAPSPTSEKVSPKSKPSTAIRAAAAEGATGNPGRARTLDKVLKVKAAADSPTTPEHVRQAARQALEEIDTTGKVDGAYKQVERIKSDTERAIELVAEFPDLAHYADQGRTSDVLRIGGALRGYLEPERTVRLNALRKTIAAELRRAEPEPAPEPEPDWLGLADHALGALNTALGVYAKAGGSATVTRAMPYASGPRQDSWRAIAELLATAAADLTHAVRPTLRSVK